MTAAGFARHGGRLGAARAAYPAAPQPWIDLSTGINPWSYPAPRARGTMLNRLPDTDELQRLESTAADAFGVPDVSRVMATAGTEPALRLLPYVLDRRTALIAGRTYGSHSHAWRSAGAATRVIEDTDLEQSLGERMVLVVVNPNNPDGRTLDRDRLLRLHERLASRDGMLIVDEAFAEVTPGTSVADIAGSEAGRHLLVLRSFGKFYGLAGLRLGFVIGAPAVLQRLRSAIGDWPVSVDALAAGLAAYADCGWSDRTRSRLARTARRLDALLTRSGFGVVGGTDLYRLVRAGDAPERFERLAGAGILTRPFEYDPTLLRFGLPGTPDAWRRLARALSGLPVLAG